MSAPGYCAEDVRVRQAMSTRKSDPAIAAAAGWSGRFSEPVAELVKRYTASVDFERRLAAADIAGSLAHARMLASVGVLSAADLAAIERGLTAIGEEIRAGTFAWSTDLEDVHLNIESRLIALVGDAGKRLHTGRSRNDQVATDLRLYVRAAIDDIVAATAALRRALLDLAEPHAATIMPGFTHLQVAQPVTFGHHLLAYEAMLARDSERMTDCRRRVNRLPLGSAALAGTGFRSTVRTLRASWASRACAPIRSMRCRTAISRSNSPPPARC